LHESGDNYLDTHRLLAGTTPHRVVVQTSQASAIPSNLQHKFTYRLYASQTDQYEDSPLLTFAEKTSNPDISR